MTEQRTCPGHGCGRPLTDGYLCHRCQHRAERVLADIAALTRELEATVARQDRVATSSRGSRVPDQDWRGETHALPVTPSPANVSASTRARTVLELLFEWADYVAQWHRMRGLPLLAAHRPLGELVPQAVAMLLSRADWMRSNEQGPTLADAIHQVRRDLRRLVDQPPERLYAGPCRADLGYDPELGYACGLALYRKWGADDITCDGHTPQPRPGQLQPTGCGTVHPAGERSEFMVAAVEEHLLPLRLLWESLYVLVPEAAGIDWRTVQQWTRERRQRTVVGTTATGRERVRITVTPARLEPASVDLDGRPLYRGGDVLRLARDAQPRRGRKRVVA